MAKGRKVSGIFVPIQLDTSLVEKDLSKLNESFGNTITAMQKGMSNALSSYKLGVGIVNINRSLGQLRDSAEALSRARVDQFTKSLQTIYPELEKLASAFGGTVQQQERLIQKMANTQAINQEVTALKTLQRELGLTANETVRLAAEMGRKPSIEASLKFGSAKDITDELSKVADKYRELARLSGTPLSESGFQNFLDSTRIQKAISAFKQLHPEQKLISDNFSQIAKAAGTSTQRVEQFINAMEKSGRIGRGWLGAFTPSNVTAGIQSGLSAFGVVGGMYGVAELTKSMYQTSLRMENIELAFQSIFNSATKAASEIAFVREVTDSLGLSFNDAADGAKNLFASAQGTVLENDVEQIFKAFSTMGAALKLTGSEMDSVFLAISQMISKGKVSAEELRLQLAERMPGAVNIFAESIGKTTSELDKMLQAGQVGLEHLKAFSLAVEERYASGAHGASRGLQAEIGRVQNAWFDLKKSFIDTDASAQYLRKITDLLKGITSIAPEIKAISSEILAFGTAFAVAYPSVILLNKALNAVLKSGGILVSIIKMSSAFASFGTSIFGVTSILTAFGVAAYEVATSLDDGQKVLEKMNSSLDDHVKLLKEAESLQGRNLTSALNVATKDYENLLSNLDKVLSPSREVEIGYGFTKEEDYGFKKSLGTIQGRWFSNLDAAKVLSEAADLGVKYGEQFKAGLAKTEVLVSTFKGSGPEVEAAFTNLQDIITKSVETFREKQADLISAGLDTDKVEEYKNATGGLIELYKKLLEQLRERAQLEKELNSSGVGINLKGYEDAIKNLNEASKGVKLFEEDKVREELSKISSSFGEVITQVDSWRAAIESGKDQGDQFTNHLKRGEEALRGFSALAVESGVNANEFIASITTKFPKAIQYVESIRDIFTEIANIRLTKGLDDFIENLETKIAFSGKSSSLASLYSSIQQKYGIDQSAKEFIEMASKGDFSGLTSGGALVGDEALVRLKEAYNLTKQWDALQEKMSKSKRASTISKNYDEVRSKIEAIVRQVETWESKTKDSKTETVGIQIDKYQSQIDKLLESGKATTSQITQLKELREEIKSVGEEYQSYILLREKEKAMGLYRSISEDYTKITGITDPYLIQQSAQSVYDERLAEVKRYLENDAITKEQYRQLEIMLDAKKNDQIRRNSQDLFDVLTVSIDDYYAKYRNFATGMGDVLTTAMTGVSSAIANFATTGMTNFKNLGQAFSDLANNILSTVNQLLASQFVSSIVKYAFGAFGTSLDTGALGESLIREQTSYSFHAKGGAFQGSSLSSYSNSVISTPTVFSMGTPIPAYARGAGLMGEAGPEAVMPLIRTPSGHLGVRAEGNASVQQTVSINIINNAGVGVRQEERQDSKGGTSIDLYIEKVTATAMARAGSAPSKVLTNIYGARPALADR